MRPWILAPLALLAFSLSPAAEAGVYTCKDENGTATFQATPCEGKSASDEYRVNASAATPIQGYNWACTHFNGRKVLNLQELAKLDSSQSEEYLDWLYSAAAPTKEEKDACLMRQRK